jgi:hypothetical protein
MLNLRGVGAEPTFCKVGRTYAALDETDRKIFREAVENVEAWSSLALERELRSNGVRLSNDTILEHRKGNCTCEGWPNA